MEKLVIMVLKSDIIPEVQLERMLKAAEHSPQDQLFLETLLATGARISEVLGLDTDNYADPMTPDSIDFDQRFVHLRNLKSKKIRRRCNADRIGKDGKTEKCGQVLKQGQTVCPCGSTDVKEEMLPKRFKDVDVSDVYLDKLKRYIEENHIEHNQRLFPFSRITGYRVVRKYAKLVGINKVGNRHMHPHTFRHSFVMNLMNKKIDLAVIQNQTGHKTIATLGEYFSITDEARKKLRDTLNKTVPQEGIEGQGVGAQNETKSN